MWRVRGRGGWGGAGEMGLGYMRMVGEWVKGCLFYF